ncbi:MAG: ribbon-helix-helix domain-containing protein [Proteobacteria bacterium]|nr:ribbon-helix-helix domain-containing protein [Pseudomonadota bacterium]
MPSQKIKKHSITIAGHRTSVTLEDVFWRALREIAQTRGLSLAALIEEIDENRQTGLSSALRVFAMQETLKNKS